MVDEADIAAMPCSATLVPSTGADMVGRALASFVILVLGVGAGCTPAAKAPRPPSSSSTALPGDAPVTDAGFTVATDGVTVSGSGDVAPHGTRAAVRRIAAPPDLAVFADHASPMVDMTLEGGRQPLTPVTVRWQVPEALSTSSLAFVTSPGPGQPWTGVPVTMSGREASVQMTHFSWGWFVDGSKLVKAYTDALSGYLGQKADPPKGCTPAATLSGVDYTLKNDHPEFAHGCLAVDEGKLLLTVASNSPYVFPLTTANGARVEAINGRPTFESIFTHTVYRNLHLAQGQPGVLLPGGTTTVRYDPALYASSGSVQVVGGELNAALGLVPIVATAFGMGLSVYGIEAPHRLDDKMAGIECAAALIDSQSTASATDVGAVAPGLMGCLATVGKEMGAHAGGKLSVVVAVFGSLMGHLVTQVRGVADTLRGGRFVMSLTRKQLASPDDVTQHTLEAGGLGPLRIGMSRKDLYAKGWAGPVSDSCYPWAESPKFAAQQVQFGPYGDAERLSEIIVRNPRIKTVSGFSVGMTLGQLRRLYGDRLREDLRDTPRGESVVLSVRSGDHEIVFWMEGERLYETARIGQMVARAYTPEVNSGC